jgi:ribosomal protein S6E (S10)
MANMENAGITPIFYNAVVEDVIATREQGRPVMVEEERVEYRIAGDRNFNPHFLAHEFHEMVNGETITHAMRWPEQYKKFKETGGNSANGTPLQNLNLKPVQLSTLKSLSVFSVEALAQLEGRDLKNLGPGGHELKRQAQRYLATTTGGVDMGEVLGKIAELEAKLAATGGAPASEPVSEPQERPYAHMADEEIKARIKEITGQGVRGQPTRATIEGMLADLEASQESAA